MEETNRRKKLLEENGFNLFIIDMMCKKLFTIYSEPSAFS